MRVTMAAFFVALGVAGCRDSASPDAVPAEVPVAGPAAQEDHGPAPPGQWEPQVEHSEPADDHLPDASNPALPEPAAPVNEPDENDAAQADDAVSLQLQSWDETDQVIASHRGKVVVVDFWATSCLPCRREFPQLIALQNAHPEDVACVSVSLDYSGRKSRPPETYREGVLKFLVEQRAAIDNVLNTDVPEELEQRLDLPPIPVVWVLDRSGERRRIFDNSRLQGDEFTYSRDVVPFVEGLLAEN